MQNKKEQKLVKAIIEQLKLLDENNLAAMLVITKTMPKTYVNEEEDENENIFTDEDDKLKNKRAKFIEPDEEDIEDDGLDDEDDDDEDEKPVKKSKVKPSKKSKVEDEDEDDDSDDDDTDDFDEEEPDDEGDESEEDESEEDESEDENEDDDDTFDETDEDYDIEVEESDDDDDEDEKPVKKSSKKQEKVSKKSTKKVEKKAPKKVVKKKATKFDSEDYDTWTEDNMRKIETYLSEDASVNIKKALGSLKGKARIKKAIQLDKETSKLNDKLEGMKTKQLLDMAKKAKLKVTGKSEKAQREKAIELLYALQASNLK